MECSELGRFSSTFLNSVMFWRQIDLKGGSDLVKHNSEKSCFWILIVFVWNHLGDDWEHEEIFTDDDEAVGNDPEEREDLAPEHPAPPEIKQVCIQWAVSGCECE